MRCSIKYPYPHPPPPPKGGRRKFREEGGVQKEAISEGLGGCLQRLFLGDMSKIGALLINNSFSVEQPISYFTVTDVSKQVS